MKKPHKILKFYPWVCLFLIYVIATLSASLAQQERPVCDRWRYPQKRTPGPSPVIVNELNQKLSPRSSVQEGTRVSRSDLQKNELESLSPSRNSLELALTKELSQQGHFRSLQEFIALLKEIQDLKGTNNSLIFRDWRVQTQDGTYHEGIAIGLNRFKEWCEESVGRPNFTEYAYALTRLLLLSVVPVRLKHLDNLGSKYGRFKAFSFLFLADRAGIDGLQSSYWVALPGSYFEQAFDPLVRIFEEVNQQFQRTRKIDMDLSEDPKRRQLQEQVAWLITEFLLPRTVSVKLNEDMLKREATHYSKLAQPSTEDYYDRLGLQPELTHRYDEADWASLVRATLEKVRIENQAQRENVEHAARMLQDPVLRALEDHWKKKGLKQLLPSGAPLESFL